MESSSGNLSGKDAEMAESYSGPEKSTKKAKKTGETSVVKPPLFESSPLGDEKSTKEPAPSLFERSPDDSKGSVLETLGLKKSSEHADDGVESEPDLPEDLKDLSESEKQHVGEELVQAHQEAVKEALDTVEPDSPEEAETLAHAMLMDILAEKAKESPLEESDVDDAVADVAQEIAIDPDSVPGDEDLPGGPHETFAEPGGEEAEPDATEAAEDDTDTVAPVASGAGAGGATPPPVATGVGGVTPPPAPSGPGSGGGVPPIFNIMMHAPNSAPISHNVMTSPTPQYERAKYQRGADLLVGGIIGYLIGRRRGRIKTEEKLLPVQHALEKKVKMLNHKITEGEKKVSKLVAEKTAREGQDIHQAIAEKLEARAMARTEAAKAERAQAETVAMPQPEVMSVTAALAAAERAREIHATQAPERTPFMPERRQPTVEVAVPTAVEKMPTPELLQIAQKIEIAGTNAKVLFEQGRIEKQDLQIVVHEFMRGSGRHESLLIEKLRPPRTSETAERLTGPTKNRDSSGSQQGVGGGSPVFSSAPVVPQAGQPVSPALSAAENRLAQARLESKQHSHMPMVVMLTAFVILALLATALVF